MDTCGQEEYQTLREYYIRSSEAFIVGYSITARSSFIVAGLYIMRFIRF